MASRINSGRAWSVPSGLAAGAGVSVCSTILMAAVLAKLIDAGKMQWENIGYGILITIMLSSYLGAATAYRTIRHQRILVCVLAAIIYLGVLLSVTALFFGGQYQSVGVTALLIFGGSACAALPVSKKKPTMRKRKVNMGYR